MQLARIFKLHAIVEGIEDETYLARLRNTHCDFGQGFYFAKPLSGEELMTFAVQQARIGVRSGATLIVEAAGSQ